MAVPRILIISEIPTPYRLPFFARLAARPEIEIEVLFCAAAEPDRPWSLDDELASVPYRILRGFSPAIRTRRNTFVYQVNPGILGVLARARFDAVVIGGYAVFAEQVALVGARLRGVPYLVHSESHDLKPRSALVRAVKRIVLPPLFRGAAAGLAVGSAAARYLAAYGMPPERIRIVPNTVDVAEYGRLARQARADAEALRARRGLPASYVLFAGRLVEAKGLPELIEARRLLGAAAPALIVAGEGPLAPDLEREPGTRLVGFQPQASLIELYALAAATVVPSRTEPWGVVVNEALACGSPVVVSDAVGAAEDLVVDGVNGRVFPAGDARALADAMRLPPPSGDAHGRIERWTYDFAIEQFLEAVALAVRS